MNELSPGKLQYRAGTIYREAGVDVKTIDQFDMHLRAARLCIRVCVCVWAQLCHEKCMDYNSFFSFLNKYLNQIGF